VKAFATGIFAVGFKYENVDVPVAGIVTFTGAAVVGLTDFTKDSPYRGSGNV